MVKKIKFIIQEQKRIDVLIAEYLPELSRSQARKLIDNGNVLINNQKVKASLMPQISSEVKITLPLIEDFDELASKINIEIIYEDESMVARRFVAACSDLPLFTSRTTRTAGQNTGTPDAAVVAICSKLKR